MFHLQKGVKIPHKV